MSLLSEKIYLNSIGMKLARIEPGSFMMGGVKIPLPIELTQDRPHLQNGDFDEHPVHQVTISRPFYLGVFEVTNSQYEQFDPQHRQLRGKLGFSKEDDEAVIFVNWHEASAFCQWLSAKEGLPYRLPTEAEWEYACRAGTNTYFHTGDALPEVFHKNVRESWYPDFDRRQGADEVVSLKVGQTPPNAWGLYDVHGNVEEWCYDCYGPYEAGDQVDPVGRADGDFRVTRGGSHSTLIYYLRSANRMGAPPDDKHWLIGFRVVLGEMPQTKPLPLPAPQLWSRNVKLEIPSNLTQSPDPNLPYFKGPRPYVKIPPNSNGPLFSAHNHDPAIVACPNGDLLAIWYTCVTERGRELNIAASRLRYGQEEWEAAAPFWGAPDRNNHAPALWFDGKDTLYHFNGLSVAATWGSPALVMRTSKDSGATWSKPRLIVPDHGLRHMPTESVFRTQDGSIVLACDAVTGGNGGTAIWISRDEGKTWSDPGAGAPKPEFAAGKTGAWIAGIHAAVVELKDSRLMALGRGDSIEGRMPKSLSADMGKSWSYSPSPFPTISGGQRCVLLRLREGSIFFASFAGERRDPKPMPIIDESRKERLVTGLFGALSFDEGETWPCLRLIGDDGPGREVETMDGRSFIMGFSSAEPGGYLSVCQAADGIIHLISSRQHYAFNLAWLNLAISHQPSAIS